MDLLEYDDLEYFISKPRLRRYLSSCDNCKDKAVQLYAANLRISKSFYPLLNLLEVVLRNSIDRQLTSFFDDPYWISTQKNGFMSDDSLQHEEHEEKPYLSYQLRKKVAKVEGDNPNNTKPKGKIISGLSLGVWGAFFDVKHYLLLKGCLIRCFPHKTNKINRKKISSSLYAIRTFRNRIYHNEPICFSNFSINVDSCEDVKTKAYNLLKWIDPKIEGHAKNYESEINDAINEAISISSSSISKVRPHRRPRTSPRPQNS